MINRNSNVSPNSSLVTRYIYILISVIIILSISIFIVIKRQSDNYATKTFKTHEFYIVGSNLASKIKDDIDRARLALLQHIKHKQNTHPESQNEKDEKNIISNIIINLADNNQLIQSLHNKYDDPDFTTLVKRIDRALNNEKIEQIIGEHSNEETRDTLFERHLKSTYIIAHQLERMYFRKLEVLNKTDSTNILGLQEKLIITLLFLIAATFTVLIIRAIKRLDDEQTSSNNLLNQFKSTLDSTNDCVFIFTADTLKFTYCNNGAMKQIGYRPDEISSMQPFDIKPEYSESQFREMISPMINGRNDFISFETIHQHKDGHTIPVEIGLQYINDENDEPHFLAIVRDITERKKTENELKQYQHQLENLVDERTQELRNTQDELVRKERLATLGNLTATVSHELRNPLGAMRPSLYVIETITKDNNNEKLQTAIQRLNRSIGRCDNIIDELLDFTRITELSLQTVVLDEWLKEVISEQPLLNGINLTYHAGLDTGQVDIDPDRMRRAFINVFENACHAMLADNSTTEVINNANLVIRTQAANGHINITVSDSGSGIPDEVMAKIFEPLFSTKGFGVGLGMPTVQQIMKQHRGGIDIDTSSAGTTVTLWLPSQQ